MCLFFITINRSMTNNKHKIDYAEFYITNVCNYACTNCNRFNNLNLKGFQKWQDFKDEYKTFSQRLDIKEIAILGGEPFLNPDIYNWIDGIAGLWPNSKIKITTNGSRRKDQKLLQMLMHYQGRVYICYSCHDENYFEPMHNSIMDFLPNSTFEVIWKTQEWKDDYDHIQGDGWPSDVIDITDSKNYVWLKQELDNINVSIYSYQNRYYNVENKKYARLESAWFFNNTAIKNKESTLYVEATSNENKAHSVCISQDCHHFINGTLSKCMIPYTLDVAIKQGNIKISKEDYKLLTSYKPLKADATENEFTNFIKNLENPIDQCKFCPEYIQPEKISIINKKELRNKNLVYFT